MELDILGLFLEKCQLKCFRWDTVGCNAVEKAAITSIEKCREQKRAEISGGCSDGIDGVDFCKP